MKEIELWKSLSSIKLRNLIKSTVQIKRMALKDGFFYKNSFAEWVLRGKLLWLLHSCCTLCALNLKQIMFINTQDGMFFGDTN